MSSLRVVLAADEAAGARTQELLERSALDLVAMAIQPGQSCPDRLATGTGAPATFDARRLKSAELAAELGELRPDVLLNVHSLYKVHPEVLQVFAVGAWNLHPGPLPEAAGINVPSWAIVNRHREHGVTVHEMTANYDEGSISYEERFPIAERATGLALSAQCASRGLLLIQQLITQLADEPANVPRVAQDLSRRQLFGPGQPNGGAIDWTRTAAEVDAYARAANFRPFASPWSAPVAEVDGRVLALHEVTIDDPVSVDVTPGDVRLSGPDHAVVSVAAVDRWVRIVEFTEMA
jgi:methionyl-tRNA formyltransferase